MKAPTFLAMLLGLVLGAFSAGAAPTTDETVAYLIKHTAESQSIPRSSAT